MQRLELSHNDIGEVGATCLAGALQRLPLLDLHDTLASYSESFMDYDCHEDDKSETEEEELEVVDLHGLSCIAMASRITPSPRAR